MPVQGAGDARQFGERERGPALHLPVEGCVRDTCLAGGPGSGAVFGSHRRLDQFNLVVVHVEYIKPTRNIRASPNGNFFSGTDCA